MLRRKEWEEILFFFHINGKFWEKGMGLVLWEKGASGGGRARTGVLGTLAGSPNLFPKNSSGGSSSSSSPYIFGPFFLLHPVFFSLRSQPTRVLRVA